DAGRVLLVRLWSRHALQTLVTACPSPTTICRVGDGASFATSGEDLSRQGDV
ncbi:MAG: hypothetical protein AVDCRST_MAG15-397, partial [uncultured Rubellimicrobium sp.]